MNYLHLEKLAAHLASTGILCLRFTCRTRNFQYRKECFTAVVVSCNEISSMFLPFVFWLSRRWGAGMGEKMGGTVNFSHYKEGDPEVDYLLLSGALKFERGRVLNK